MGPAPTTAPISPPMILPFHCIRRAAPRDFLTAPPPACTMRASSRRQCYQPPGFFPMTGPYRTVYESRVSGLDKIHQGKVRDIYAIDAEHMLIVTTDRLSAFDVVLPDPIPFKGAVLTRISDFWFRRTRALISNQLASMPLEQVIRDPDELELLRDRAIVVKRLKPLPLEAVARGYLIGSGWKDYQRDGAVCGIALPAGLRLADRLPEPIFTPATKAP